MNKCLDVYTASGKWSEIEGLLTWTNERMTRDRVNNTPPSADFKDTGQCIKRVSPMP